MKLENKSERKFRNEWNLWPYKMYKKTNKIRSELMWVLITKFYSGVSQQRIRKANFARYESARLDGRSVRHFSLSSHAYKNKNKTNKKTVLRKSAILVQFFVALIFTGVYKSGIWMESYLLHLHWSNQLRSYPAQFARYECACLVTVGHLTMAQQRWWCVAVRTKQVAWTWGQTKHKRAATITKLSI
jgi:hypothetical protein